MLSCTTSPAMRVDRSARGGALSEESLDHSDGALDGGALVGIELAQEPLDRRDAHVAPARERANAFRCRVHAYDPSVVTVGHLAGDAGSVHVAHESTHRREPHLLRGGELAERLRA